MDWRVVAVMDLIRTRQVHSLPINVDGLAAAVNLSKSRLSHIFVSECGATLKAYMSRSRVQIACELLTGTALSVKEISTVVGYAHQSALTKQFTDEMAETPTGYRQRKRNGDAQAVTASDNK